jgi:hypothetical protein
MDAAPKLTIFLGFHLQDIFRLYYSFYNIPHGKHWGGSTVTGVKTEEAVGK